MAAQRLHSVPAHLRKKKPGHAQQQQPGLSGSNGGRASDEAFDGADHSSRDASEEDNDDISGASDSASSLRTLSRPSNASALPTSARDRALVDSNPRRPSAGASSLVNAAGLGDKTPGSNSPPRMGAVPRRPSGQQAGKDAVSHTLERASAALSSSSGGSSDAPRAFAAPEAVVTRKVSSRPKSGSSSAGSTGDGPEPGSVSASRSPTLELKNLPAPSLAAGGGPAATPRAGDAAQRAALLASGGQGEEGHGEASESDAARGETAASPYDGDVEYAARTPQTNAGAHHGAAAPAAAGHSPAGGASASLGFGTAPPDTPSHSYLGPSGTLVAQGTLPRAAREETPHSEVPVPIATNETIREYIYKAIHEPDPARPYKINLPPDGGRNPDRPVRIYADGVYDLFHYAHSLQLRQAKLFFPCVHLIVGVVSSQSCAQHKNEPVLSSAERYASVRNCRWVDEVLEDAPWVIDQDLIDRLRIDYVAHDEAPYASKDGGNTDIYGFCKEQGRFLPTLRTPGVSTTELLGRIVTQFKQHKWDDKLAKVLGDVSID